MVKPTQPRQISRQEKAVNQYAANNNIKNIQATVNQ